MRIDVMDNPMLIRRLVLAGVLALGASACTVDLRGGRSDTGQADTGPRRPLVVYADTNTAAAMRKIESAFERGHNVDVMLNFGHTDSLANRVMTANTADVILAVDTIALAKLDSAALVISDTRYVVFHNQLVVVESWDTASVFRPPFEPAQLVDTMVRQLALADPNSSPPGRYAKAWLQRAGLWDSLASRVKASPEIMGALATLEAGEAQAAIVFRTEVMASPKFRTIYMIPVDSGPPVPYSTAVVSGRASEEDARIFVDYLSSPVARQIFEVMGFLVPRAAPPAP
jgi:molybdate transport system substrate-binding protein